MRNFNISIDELLQYGSMVQEYLKTDLPDFTAMDPDLNADKVAELETLLDAALREGGDGSNRAELGQKTETLLAELGEARKLFNQLRYWILKTYPDSTATQRKFGVGRFSKITRSQMGMISFFFELAEMITAHRAELEGKGTPAALLDGVVAQAETLKTAQMEQETQKGNRIVNTEARIKRLNTIYDILRSFNAAAEFVYFDEVAKRDRYRTPSGSKTAEEETLLVDEAA
ncbi:MAG: hypothetical protein R8G66_18115 [Cytophagales bacterium]|nr:hypothetical protein [Cytophagales bacterium]